MNPTKSDQKKYIQLVGAVAKMNFQTERVGCIIGFAPSSRASPARERGTVETLDGVEPARPPRFDPFRVVVAAITTVGFTYGYSCGSPPGFRQGEKGTWQESELRPNPMACLNRAF